MTGIPRTVSASARRLYVALAVTRLLMTLSPGYVHPDEAFQWLEPAAQLMGFHAQLPFVLLSF